MNSHFAKPFLISLLFVMMVQRCCCVSPVEQKRKTPERRSQLALPTVTCSGRGIKAVFDPLVKKNVHVRDLTGALIPLLKSEGACGVRLGKDRNRTSVVSRYDSCYALVEGTNIIIPLQVQLSGEDQWIRVNISCPLIKRRSERTHPTPTPTPFPGSCDIQKALRLDCGSHSTSSEACYKLGCCYDTDDSNCYYRLDACSLDGHFVFSVKAADTHPPINPSSLIIKNQPHCLPVITTADTAVFKIGVMDCGAKMKVEGDKLIYEVEVEELTSGSASKHSPFSLEVQCDYEASDLRRAQDLRSLYTVTNPPPVVALGTIRVQMRIATDASFGSFIPDDQLPLTLPLREAVNVEIAIVQPSPDPWLSLRVRDCFAYPASRHSVWTLLYDGCPNPLDNMRSSVPVDHQGRTTSHSQVRRFNVKTFAFLEPHSGHPSTEQLYFYCWVEICTYDSECAQRCTIISPESERHRREAPFESDQVQLISFGPLLQNDTEPERSPCDKQKTAFQITVYVLAGVVAVLLLVLLCIVWSSVRRHQQKETQRAGGEPSQ